MKIIYFFLFIFFIAQIALIAGGPANGTIVSTYYLTFPLAYQESDSDSLKVSVLITSFSYYETNVAITIKSRNYRKEITLAPYSSEVVFFDIADAFLVQRKVNDTIAYENVYSGSAIKIEADNRIHCYGFLKSKNICEGFMVYPLEALNERYIVSTLSSNNKNYPSYTAIVGAYDNTKVTFRMGGCDNCKTIDNFGIAIINNICQDTCLVKFFTEISADIYDVFVQVDGVDFGEQIINSPYSSKKLTIQNPIIKPFISEQTIKIIAYEFIGDSIGDFNSNKVFKIFGIDQVSEENPITIDVGEKHLFDVYFAPDTSKTYFTNIQFKILTDISPIFITEPDHEAIITGIAKIGTSAEDNVYSGDIVIPPNPASEYITINLERCATLQKCGTSEIEIYDVMGVKIHPPRQLTLTPLKEGNFETINFFWSYI